MVHRIIRPAIFLAIGWLIVRTWAIDGLGIPLVIPSGSMALTLLGPHRDVVCADCGYPYAVGIVPHSFSSVMVCPNCGATNNLHNLPESDGEHVLVDRTAFQWRNPRRWEVVAFRSPSKASMICVKRVVGLPGEEVQIRAGDVYINGQLQRKTLAQQRALAVLIHDANHESALKPSLPSCWQSPSGSHWELSGGRFQCRYSENSGTMNWCVFHHWQWAPGTSGKARETPVDDDLPYNRAWPQRSDEIQPVRDLLLSFRVIQAAGEGCLAVRARSGRHEWMLMIYPAAKRYEALADNISFARGLIPGQQNSHWDVSLIDQQFLVAVDDQTLITCPFETTDYEPVGEQKLLAIGCRELQAEIADVRVYRDVYYTRPTGVEARWGCDQPFRLGADEYFVLGDNSPISEDSRIWSKGAGVPAKLLYGRPFLVNFHPRSYRCWGKWITLPDLTQIRLIHE